MNTELIPALDKERRKVRVTGTPLADDCLLARCERARRASYHELAALIVPLLAGQRT